MPGAGPGPLARYRLAPRRREITFGRLCDSAAVAGARRNASRAEPGLTRLDLGDCDSPLEFAGPSSPSNHDQVVRRHGPLLRVGASLRHRLLLGLVKRSSRRRRRTRSWKSSEAAQPQATPALPRASRNLGGLRRHGSDCRCHRKRLSRWGASTRALQKPKTNSCGRQLSERFLGSGHGFSGDPPDPSGNGAAS